MNITRLNLLELGWEPVNNSQHRFHYKGITGWLNTETGSFQLDGFLPSIITQMDLRFVMMLIDYNEHDTLTPYPSHLN